MFDMLGKTRQYFLSGLAGVLMFMVTCVTCTCYVTSLGWGKC